MAIANYVSSGDSVDYTPSADTPAGSVIVQGTTVGVTKVPILANALGTIHVVGVYDVDSASATTFSAGALVYWNAASGKATSTNTDVLMGRAAVAKVSGDTKVRVRLSPA